jgi:hypothetical protein
MTSMKEKSRRKQLGSIIDTSIIHVLARVTFGSLLHSIYENIETSVFENNKNYDDNYKT